MFIYFCCFQLLFLETVSWKIIKSDLRSSDRSIWSGKTTRSAKSTLQDPYQHIQKIADQVRNFKIRDFIVLCLKLISS